MLRRRAANAARQFSRKSMLICDSDLVVGKLVHIDAATDISNDASANAVDVANVKKYFGHAVGKQMVIKHCR